jgi:hypothetical protein
MKSLSLYEMTNEMLEVLEAEEVDEALMEAAFGNIVAKESRIAFFIKDIEASADAHKAEEKRLSDRRKAMENKVKQLKGYIQLCMERLGMDAVQTGTFKLAIQNNPPALDRYDESAPLPAEFTVIIPEQIQPDNAKIKDALKIGVEVPGYRLTQGRSLRIR